MKGDIEALEKVQKGQKDAAITEVF